MPVSALDSSNLPDSGTTTADILEHVRDHPIRSGIIQICGRSYSVTLRLDDGKEIPNVESTIVQELYANGALPEYLSYQLNRLHIIED
jgi:hypothetical protein